MRMSFGFSTERDKPCGSVSVVDINEMVLVNMKKRRKT
jgi:hypothetical protein